MNTGTFKGAILLRQLEASLRRQGLEQHLAFAREMAAEGVSARDLMTMMRGNFSSDVVDALLAEAKATSAAD